MRKLFGILVALSLIGSLVQIIVLYFMPFVNMINFGNHEMQLLGLAVLFIPIVLFVGIYKFIMKIVTHLFHRKGNW